LAAVEALYYAKTGDVTYKEAAYRSFNWVTYFQGLSGGAHAPFSTQWWFTDQFADGPRRVMDAFWAVPEWAPAQESHLVGSSSVVTHINYGKGSVTYTTFDAQSSDVLRLDFTPDSVTGDGRPLTTFTFDEKTHVLRIQHDNAKDIDIQGIGGSAPPLYVTFDDPHLAAGTVLDGQYLIDWGKAQWRIGVPNGKFGTFNLVLADPKSQHAQFRFYQPRIFAGIDIYNGGAAEATVTISSPNAREIPFTIEPGQLRRVRTEWRDPTFSVNFEFKNAEAIRFDNLAYFRE
jgi:hypothetical protein